MLMMICKPMLGEKGKESVDIQTKPNNLCNTNGIKV